MIKLSEIEKYYNGKIHIDFEEDYEIMNKEQIKYLLDNIDCEVKSNTNWVEPLGLDRDTWKALLEYIQLKENIIKEVREYVEKELSGYAPRDFRDLVDGYSVLEILDKENNDE